MTAPSRILLVDDEPTIQRTLHRALERLGFRVTSVADGDEALRVLEGALCDVILTDLTMEGTDGLAVLERAKQRDPDCAVVIMTGFGAADSAIEALRRGADDYVAKPFDYEELLLRVGRCAERCRLRRKVRLYEHLLPVCPVCEKVSDPRRRLGRDEWMPLEAALEHRAGTRTPRDCCPECRDAGGDGARVPPRPLFP